MYILIIMIILDNILKFWCHFKTFINHSHFLNVNFIFWLKFFVFWSPNFNRTFVNNLTIKDKKWNLWNQSLITTKYNKNKLIILVTINLILKKYFLLYFFSKYFQLIKYWSFAVSYFIEQLLINFVVGLDYYFFLLLVFLFYLC